MKKLLMLVLILSLILSGCVRKETAELPEYTCQDGRIVYDYHLCNNGENNGGGNISNVSYFENDSEGLSNGSFSCEDSDGGRVYETRGTVVLGQEEELDLCIDEYTIREYWCEKNKIRYEEVGCSEGQKCINGKCSEGSCWDSDGLNESSLGVVEKEGVSYQDECQDVNTVKEYYCEGGVVKIQNIKCSSTEECAGGICIAKQTELCTDTDEGQDKFEAGTTTCGSTIHTDSCYSGTSVIEYYCEDGEIESVILSCNEGHSCQNGECIEIQEDECDNEEEEFEEENVFHEVAMLDGTFKIYAGEAVRIKNGRLLELPEFGSDGAKLTLYENYEKFLSRESFCSEVVVPDNRYDFCAEHEFEDENADWDTLKFKSKEMRDYHIQNSSLDLGDDCEIGFEYYLEITTSEQFELEAQWMGWSSPDARIGDRIIYVPAGNVIETECEDQYNGDDPIVVFEDEDGDWFGYIFDSEEFLAIECNYGSLQRVVSIYGPSETESGNDEVWIVEEVGEWGMKELVAAMGFQIDSNFELREALKSEEVADEDYIGFLIGEKDDIGDTGDIYAHSMSFSEEGYYSHNGYEEDFISMGGTEFSSGSDHEYKFKIPDMLLESTYTTYNIEIQTGEIKAGDYAEIETDGAVVSQYSTLEGVDVEWSGSGCGEDERVYEKQILQFYPCLNTETDGTILLFENEEFQIIDLDFEHEEFVFEGGEEDLVIDGEYDSFRYNEKEYDISVTFEEEEISKILVELS